MAKIVSQKREVTVRAADEEATPSVFFSGLGLALTAMCIAAGAGVVWLAIQAK